MDLLNEIEIFEFDGHSGERDSEQVGKGPHRQTLDASVSSKPESALPQGSLGERLTIDPLPIGRAEVKENLLVHG